MNANLYFVLQQGFGEHLDATCLQLADGSVITYGELADWSDRLAQALLQHAQAGDRILVQVEKSAAAVALYLACLRSGVVLVPLNTAYTRAELEYFISDAEPALVIADTSGATSLQRLCEQAQSHTANGAIVSRAEHELAAILYTSGTTGRSKGAMLSHANLASNALTLHKLWGFVPGDVLLHALPVFHAHGLFVALNTAMLNASKILFLEKFVLPEVLAALPQATVMMGVPTFYTRLLASPDFAEQHFAHMRLFISGSAPLTESTFAAFAARTGHQILERYGMSEAGMITSNPLQGERIAGSVGFALPGVELRIADEQGRALAAGEVGVIEVRGPNIFAGYWQMPEKTASELRADGFFISGDMGVMDASGRVSIVGREKDLIISGGYNVYPKEVELCMDALDGIEEAAVIGLPHADFGEAVVAVCVAQGESLPSHEQVMEQLKEQLARFKQPKQLIQIEELPRNSMGKVQKNVLREQYQALFDH